MQLRRCLPLGKISPNDRIMTLKGGDMHLLFIPLRRKVGTHDSHWTSGITNTYLVVSANQMSEAH